MFSLTMMMHFLGGLGLFLYGVNVTSDGLQKIAANRLKNILASLTKRPWGATLFGVIMTIALQSSTATTVMVVEFVNSGLMTLTQALGVVLGSALGTSIVIQLISFPILDFALFLLFVGFILFLVVRTALTKSIGQILIGFGCIFVGIAFLTGAFAPVKNSPEVYAFLSQFGSIPILGILVSILATAIIQSSAAFLAILISLASQGLLSIEAIVPLVMGAHIGGTVTTLISSLGAERVDAKRVAIANSLYRIAAALILLPFIPYFAKFIQWSAADLPRQVANTHLFSAIFMVVIFLPLNGLLAKSLIRMVPQGKSKGQESRTKYISKAALEVPAVALSQASQEIRWLGYKILENMLEILPRVLFSGDARWILELEQAEKEVDWHYSQISEFLMALFHRNMTRQQIVENHGLQLVAKELEYIADSLIVMARLGNKISYDKIAVDKSDWEQMDELYTAISNNYLTLLRLLDRWDKALADQVIKSHDEIIGIYSFVQGSLVYQIHHNELPDVSAHVQREEDGGWKENLTEGQKNILELDNWLYKIGEHIVRIAKNMEN